MTYLIFILAVFFLLLGFTFFYRPAWIARFNKFVRDRLLNDSILLLERRKKGILFLLISALFFYMGYFLEHYRPSRLSYRLLSNDRLLYQSLVNLHSQRYWWSKKLCERVLSKDPNNSQALYQLGATYVLMNMPQEGEKVWQRALELEPNSPDAENLRKLVTSLRRDSVSFLR
ncbi:MAG: tetratricopeptide repeat protein [Elusimicrobia bacterium]|nr:tetratricopeptide repeat protein [Elusimicrobiota bacterium]